MAFLTTIFFAFLGICGLVGCARALRLVIRAINGIFDKFVVLLAGHRRRAEEGCDFGHLWPENKERIGDCRYYAFGRGYQLRCCFPCDGFGRDTD